MKLKRVRDTTEKKVLRWTNSLWKICQVYTDWTNFNVRNDTTKERENFDNASVFWPQRKELPEEDNIGVYDTFVAENYGTPEDTFTATYIFYDYDEETVLKSWTVDDYGTPVAPADPTRTWYTFTGREPEVWAITKNTDYVAQYEINQYTVTINTTDATMWTVDETEVTVDYGTEISADNNVLTIWDTEITATAEIWYEFVNWTVWADSLPASVGGDMTITANFQAEQQEEEPWE